MVLGNLVSDQCDPDVMVIRGNGFDNQSSNPVCVSLHANAFEEGMNLSVLPSAIDK